MPARPRARPPQDRLVLRACQGDVGEPELLAALLNYVLLAVARVLGALERDVDRPLAGLVVEEDGFVRRYEGWLPQEWAVDDRELEPFAAVDRQDLDSLCVRLEPAAALLVTRVSLRLGDALPKPRA